MRRNWPLVVLALLVVGCGGRAAQYKADAENAAAEYMVCRAKVDEWAAAWQEQVAVVAEVQDANRVLLENLAACQDRDIDDFGTLDPEDDR